MIDWDRIDNLTYFESMETLWDIADWMEEKLAKIRMGMYDEERHGNLRETLEELEDLF